MKNKRKEEIIKKWEESGLLNGLTKMDERKRPSEGLIDMMNCGFQKLEEEQTQTLHEPIFSGLLPTEEQVLQKIFDCVSIRGIELEDYKYNFINEQSGLYDALVKLFKGNG